MVLLGIYLVYPAVVTVIGSFQDKNGAFTLANWQSLATPPFVEILRNNVALAPDRRQPAAFVLGLLTAGLFDRIRRESLAKIFIFLPLAISLVGATVIWKFVYAWQPPSQPQYGLLNAVWTAFGGSRSVGHAVPHQPPVGDGHPDLAPDRLRHGRVLGGHQGRVDRDHRGGQARRRHGAPDVPQGRSCPSIRGTIVTVTTTVAIVTLKIFDIVMSVSGGLNHDDVVAVRMFKEMFQYFNDGRAAALATVLFIAVLPVMILNLRNFRRQAADVMTAPPSRPHGPTSKGRTRFWRAPMLQSAPLRISVVVHLPPVVPAHRWGCSSAPSGTPQLITQTGWWTALLHPFEQGQWTLAELPAGDRRRRHGRRRSSTASS